MRRQFLLGGTAFSVSTFLNGSIVSEYMHEESRFSHQTYLLKRQFAKLLGANFRVYSPSGDLVLFVHQKAFKLKEDIRIFADEQSSEELLCIKARQIMDFKAAYDVVDSKTGQKLGAFKRKGWSSIIRDEWLVMDAQDQEIGKIIEDSMFLALIRRLLTNLVPQSFDLVVKDRKICDLKQRFNPFLFQMDIDFSSDPGASMDRRLGIVAAILIAAIEGRQSG